MAKKIDPLNGKQYGAVSANLICGDIKAAVSFYTKALGFTKRSIMNGPDKKPVHAELTLRGTTVMISPEMGGGKSAKTLGGSPITLYLLTENADKTVAKAAKLGAKVTVPVGDMFWGDRCGTIVDPEGFSWMIATHMSEPTPQEMNKKMKEMMSQQQGGAAGA